MCFPWAWRTQSRTGHSLFPNPIPYSETKSLHRNLDWTFIFFLIPLLPFIILLHSFAVHSVLLWSNTMVPYIPRRIIRYTKLICWRAYLVYVLNQLLYSGSLKSVGLCGMGIDFKNKEENVLVYPNLNSQGSWCFKSGVQVFCIWEVFRIILLWRVQYSRNQDLQRTFILFKIVMRTESWQCF